jgi:multiple sugar transport system permease protein
MVEIAARKRKKIDKEGISGLIMAIIPVFGFILFGLIPMVLAIGMAFMKIKGYSFDSVSFIGFDNFKTILSDKGFYDSIKYTLLMSISMPISLILSLIIAFLLSKEITGKKFYRTVFFIPYVCSVVAVSLMWKWIFNTNFGVLNQLIGRTGENAIDWLGDSTTFIIAMNILSIWSGTGYGIILFSAALTNVNSTLYEAAKVDGAGAYRCFFSITLPSISPTTFYLFTMGLIGALQSFAVTNIIASGGGPNNAGVTIVFYLYRRAFEYVNMMGEASAVAWLLAVMILIVTIINFIVSKKWVKYD